MANSSNWAVGELEGAGRGRAVGSRWVQQTARLSTGVTLPYVEQGRRDGTPVVLLHGYTDSWRSFEPLLGQLPESVRTFALTQRGHGDADRPAEGYRAEHFARDLAAWMDSAGLGSAVIVGHCFGAHVAQRFAIDHPERTRALVLVSAFHQLASHAGLQELQADVARLSDPVDTSFVRAFQESTLSQPVPSTFLDVVVQESRKVPARVWKAVLEGFMASDFSATERSRISRPTRLVWGTADAFLARAEQESLLKAIPGSDLLEYSATGHGVHWEEPGQFARDLTVFLRRI